MIRKILPTLCTLILLSGCNSNQPACKQVYTGDRLERKIYAFMEKDLKRLQAKPYKNEREQQLQTFYIDSLADKQQNKQ